MSLNSSKKIVRGNLVYQENKKACPVCNSATDTSFFRERGWGSWRRCRNECCKWHGRWEPKYGLTPLYEENKNNSKPRSPAI